jgi:hypothetical protein
VQWLIPIILVTLEVEIGRIVVRGQPWYKVYETPFQSIKLGMVVCSIIPAMWEAYIGVSRFTLAWAWMQDPISKTTAQKGWGMAPVLECLSWKYKSLSSNSSTAKVLRDLLKLHFYLAFYSYSMMTFKWYGHQIRVNFRIGFIEFSLYVFTKIK